MGFAKKPPPGRKWGSLREYSQRIHVGGKAWDKLPYRLKQLSAYRADHHPAIVKGHLPIRRYARKRGVGLSSAITLGTKVVFALSKFNRLKDKKKK